MHHLIQITLAELKDACKDMFNGVSWERDWTPKGGTLYVGQYSAGQAVISGPIPVGNPNKPWFQVQAAHPDVITALSAIASESMEMHEAITSRGPMRAAHKARGARVLRNQAGKAVGVMCDIEICGSGAAQSSLGGRDPEEMPELEGLDP